LNVFQGKSAASREIGSPACRAALKLMQLIVTGNIFTPMNTFLVIPQKKVPLPKGLFFIYGNSAQNRIEAEMHGK